MEQNKSSRSFAKVSLKILKYVILATIAIICATTSYRFGKQIFSDEGVERAPGTDMTYTVSKGTTINELGDELEELGIINSGNVFKVQSYLYDVHSVKPGTYNFNTSYGAEEIFRIISEGPNEDKEEATTTEESEE
jgi:UPF0755 protein